MIKPGEIQQKARETGVRDQQIEKDYVLSWILKGISQHENLSKAIVFKGGTVLKKFYFEDYRYSEDLDFTLLDENIFIIRRNHLSFFIGKGAYAKFHSSIVEQHFRIMKRQSVFSYILTKKRIERASSDVGFMFIAYNLRRIVNILTRDQLKEYLRILLAWFLTITDLIRDNLRQYKRSIYLERYLKVKTMHRLNSLEKGHINQPGTGY